MKEDKGGSEARREPTTQQLLDQARKRAAERGIQLLPGSDFKLSEAQRKIITQIVDRKASDIQAFLDEIEDIAERYATELIQREGLLSPAELRSTLTSIRTHAVEILKCFSSLGMLDDGYSASGESVRTVFASGDSEDSLSRYFFQRDLFADLVLLVESIDESLAYDAESIDTEIQDLNDAGDFFRTFPRIYGLEILRKHNQRLVPGSGRPKKDAERHLIKQVALAYDAHFGNLPSRSTTSRFVDLIAFLHSAVSPNAAQTDYSRLVKTSLKELESEIGTNPDDSPDFHT